MGRGRHAVAVIGGGPAGSTMARTLAAAGVTTAVVDCSRVDSWKVGESLPPWGTAWLRDVGLWPRFVADGHLPAYGNRSAWGGPELADHDFLFDPRGPGWHVDRSRFDEMLRAAASEAGATRVEGRVLTARRGNDSGWDLEVSGPGPTASVQAEFVVDATGRASWFARRHGSRRGYVDHLVGAAALLQPSGAEGLEWTTMVEAAEGGWWYSAPVPAGMMVVVYFTDADLLPAAARRSAGWCQLLAGTRHTRTRAGDFRLASGPRVLSAASSVLEPPRGPGWLAVGDAATTHDPLSSQGICAALASGRSAAQAVIDHLGGDDEGLTAHAQSTTKAYARYLAERAAYYRLERRWPWSPFWQRRRGGGPAASTPDGSRRPATTGRQR